MRAGLAFLALCCLLAVPAYANKVVPVPAKWTACKLDSDCEMVDNECSRKGCLEGVISKAWTEKYLSTTKLKACGHAGSLNASCNQPAPVLKCVKHHCIAG